MTIDRNLPVLFDVDNVCADFIGGALRATGSSLKPEHITHYRMEEIMEPHASACFQSTLDEPLFWRMLSPLQGS